MRCENQGQPLFHVYSGRNLHTTCRPLIHLLEQERHRLEFPVK
jgi:hypothetical protein